MDGGWRAPGRPGREPAPAASGLRLAQGRTDAALAAVRTALLAETINRRVWARLLAAEAEIALAAGAGDCAAINAGSP